jgi:TrpR-related protein YerC/YecD
MPANPKLKDNLTDQLFQAILALQTEEECYQFFEDVCTIGEIKAMAQRLEVARLLKAGVIYDDIVATTGASTATISRVKRCLFYGADGYKTVLARLDEDQDGENGVEQ